MLLNVLGIQFNLLVTLQVGPQVGLGHRVEEEHFNQMRIH